MEHAVYVCTWSQSSEGFALWLKSRPQIQAKAATYAEAELGLIRAIQQAMGAMQAVLEFDPPLPRSSLEQKYASPELYLIGGDERFETNAPRWSRSESPADVDQRLRWNDEFYSAPVCRKCKYPAGRRSDKPLALQYAPGGYDGAFGSVGTDGGPTHQIVSTEFLALLSDEEKSRLDFRATIRKGRRTFHELIGPDGPPLVATSGLKPNGWRCTACEHRTWGYWIEGLAISSFIARCDLAQQLTGVFTVGVAPEIQLAVTAARWQELVGRKGTRGFTSCLLGVSPDHEVMRCPDVPTLEERIQR